MHKVVNKTTKSNKVEIIEKSSVPPQKRAPRPSETHAGDMQKLYLTAHAQCRGAGQNVNPQKYDRLCSSKRVIFHHYGIEHTDRDILEEEETLYIKNSMEEEEDKTLLRVKRGLVKYPPAPPDRQMD